MPFGRQNAAVIAPQEVPGPAVSMTESFEVRDAPFRSIVQWVSAGSPDSAKSS